MSIKCTGCHQDINFIRTKKNNKAIPVNLDEITIITRDGWVTKGYLAHWTTCPKAGQFRVPSKANATRQREPGEDDIDPPF